MPVGGVCECALKLPRVWEGCVAIRLHITGCQPDSGKPTVRDERGACGNVGYGGIRNPPRLSKERVLETLRLRSYAPHFYPTGCVTARVSQANQVIKVSIRHPFDIQIYR